MAMTKPAYAVAATAIFGVEVLIALFIDDAFVRPYLGDALAVLMAYLALRAITPLTIDQAVASALCLAALIELGQLLGLLDILGLRSNQLARTVLGGVFDMRDLLAYIVGALMAVLGEVALRRIHPQRDAEKNILRTRTKREMLFSQPATPAPEAGPVAGSSES